MKFFFLIQFLQKFFHFAFFIMVIMLLHLQFYFIFINFPQAIFKKSFNYINFLFIKDFLQTNDDLIVLFLIFFINGCFPFKLKLIMEFFNQFSKLLTLQSETLLQQYYFKYLINLYLMDLECFYLINYTLLLSGITNSIN